MARRKVLGYKEALYLLRDGKEIQYLGGGSPSAFIWLSDGFATVRLDALEKLSKQGLITDYGYPELNSTIRLKEAAK